MPGIHGSDCGSMGKRCRLKVPRALAVLGSEFRRIQSLYSLEARAASTGDDREKLGMASSGKVKGGGSIMAQAEPDEKLDKMIFEYEM